MLHRRAWAEVLQVLNDHICQPKLPNRAKLSAIIEGERKNFHNKNRFKEFYVHKPSSTEEY